MNDSNSVVPTDSFTVVIPAYLQGFRMDVEFNYDTTDPWAVKLTFPTPKKPSWLVDRDLLWIGLERENGLGDIHVTPTPDGVAVRLSAPQKVEGAECRVWEAATVVFDTEKLAAALHDTYQMCLMGREEFDLDYELGLLGVVA